MDSVAKLAQLFGGGPQAAFLAVVCFVAGALFGLLMRAHRRELALAMRVVVLAERLAPLVQKAQRRSGSTGAHSTVEAPHVEE